MDLTSGVEWLRKHGRSVRWTNWAGTHGCEAVEVEPADEAGVVWAVRAAEAAGRRVRVVGAGHSPNDGARVDRGHDVQLRLGRLAHVRLRADAAAASAGRDAAGWARVRVGAGARLADVHPALRRLGLALPTLGSISAQTVGGAVATATHGTGARLGSLSSYVSALRVVVRAGGAWAAVECSAAERPELFAAARCSLGALGVVTEVELRCPPAYDVDAVEDGRGSFAEWLAAGPAAWRALALSADRVRLVWVPHTDLCAIWRASDVPVVHTHSRSESESDSDSESHTPSESMVVSSESHLGALARALRWLRPARLRTALVHGALELLLAAGCAAPWLVPWVNLLAARALFSGVRRTRGPMPAVLNYDIYFRQHVVEWAMPLDAAPTVLACLREAVRERGLRVHFPVEVRFCAAEPDVWLSPSGGGGADIWCYVGLVMYRPFGLDPPRYGEYFDVLQDIALRHGGRPHWAKSFALDECALRALYPAAAWDGFRAVRMQCDPGFLFGNAFVRRYFSS
jgi:L-gulonolactone oxidase